MKTQLEQNDNVRHKALADPPMLCGGKLILRLHLRISPEFIEGLSCVAEFTPHHFRV